MLVLTRRIGEEIVIADNTRVVVLAIKGQKVRLGINAPPSVGVLRQELVKEEAKPGASLSFAQPRMKP
jgi:carbon storage regulator